jgi:hypothetical protein
MFNVRLEIMYILQLTVRNYFQYWAVIEIQYFAITKINWLELFKEIIPVYSENHMKLVNTKRKMIVTAGGT